MRTVQREVDEREPALPSGQVTLDPTAVELDGDPATDLDPRQRGFNVTATPLAHNRRDPLTTNDKGAEMATVIRCECGYVARGEDDDSLLADITRHMESDHPELVGQVGRDDLLAMAEEE